MGDVQYAATVLLGNAMMRKLRQAHIAVVWEADTTQRRGCQQALGRCMTELSEARAKIDECNAMYSDLMNDRDEWQALALDQSETIENMAQNVSAQFELGNCKTAFELLREQLRKSRVETDALQDELAGVQAALENWRGGALSAKQRCNTCRHLHSGLPCMVCELLRLHVHGKTTETFGCTLWEEVPTHE